MMRNILAATVMVGAFLASPVHAGIYGTQLVADIPATAKPGAQFTVVATLTGSFFVRWIQPNASGEGAYIVLYQGGTEVGRFRINRNNTPVTHTTTAAGPSGSTDVIGLGSKAVATFTVAAPNAVGPQDYTVIFTGDRWGSESTTGPLTVKVGYPDVTSVIVPLLSD